jgi:hypothetical protein
VGWRGWSAGLAGALLCAGCAIPVSKLPDLPADGVEAGELLVVGAVPDLKFPIEPAAPDSNY